MPRVITFLTDFGLMDDFVGTCHGVMKRIAPEAEIIDITHGISPQSVLEGALVLANTVPFMPEGVHLAVVDPGVGSQRRALALRDENGRLYVGPDNGLLIPAAERMGGISQARELVNSEFWLDSVSRTFHGRDLFAPVAAHLAQGVALEELGRELDPGELVRLEVPEPSLGSSSIRARALMIDRFGNVQLNLTRRHLERVGILPGVQVELELATERYYAVAARTFSDVRPGEIVLYEDAYENISIAITTGNAAETLPPRRATTSGSALPSDASAAGRSGLRPIGDEYCRSLAAGLAGPEAGSTLDVRSGRASVGGEEATGFLRRLRGGARRGARSSARARRGHGDGRRSIRDCAPVPDRGSRRSRSGRSDDCRGTPAGTCRAG